MDDVVKTFFKIQEKLPSKLIMVGDGPERALAEKISRRLGIKEKVIFLGNSNEIEKILCFSDLFLLPSETESFGLAALEAMAFGVPVISTDTGGLPEVNIDGYSGYLSGVGEIDDMAEKAVQMLSDKILHQKFKKQAKETAAKFHIDKVVVQYEKLYESSFSSLLN